MNARELIGVVPSAGPTWGHMIFRFSRLDLSSDTSQVPKTATRRDGFGSKLDSKLTISFKIRSAPWLGSISFQGAKFPHLSLHGQIPLRFGGQEVSLPLP